MDVAEVVLKGDDRVAHYKGQLVWLKKHKCSMIFSGREEHLHLKNVRKQLLSTVETAIFLQLREMTDDNVNQFVGLMVDSSLPISVWKYCTKDSLQVSYSQLK